MNSSRPYLIRAIYDWLTDNQLTPYLLVNAKYEAVQVPENYIENGKIVLNIATRAVKHLVMDNSAVSFNAHFSGSPTDIYIPIEACLAIYSKENGQGMVFNEESGNDPERPNDSEKKGLPKPNLKIVK